jgi:hypothetical protein
VHRGEAESELRVSVTVSSVDAPQPEDMTPAIIMRSKRPSLLPRLESDSTQSQQQQQQ